MINQFGGSWTERKMEIVVAYAKAYLTIMQAQAWAKTLYFDGFAGSGSIVDEDVKEISLHKDLWEEWTESEEEIKKGTALRILEIVQPKPFDMYYFVEKNEAHQRELKAQVATKFPSRNTHVVPGDCNEKLIKMAGFLKENREYRALAFIDPYGMSVNWSSIEALKGLGVDLWILVPTGVGANRVLVNDGNIPEAWLCKLEAFLRIGREEIKKQFYKEIKMASLFGDGEQTLMAKEKDAVNKLGKLYSARLKEVFTYVSEPFVMRNSMNSIMYHFMMATNNTAALRIANDVIKPKYKI
ncbi:MAG TPA: three-Cys-motif partner protein TcmP [Flavisolibacter sp.]|jgi:three-Cys-motif partner protein|nr:three-Cys-motif partner protein TcmP [Flavisolibacter sp.]